MKNLKWVKGNVRSIMESGDLVFSQFLIYKKLFKSCRLSFLLSGSDCVLVKEELHVYPNLLVLGCQFLALH